MVGLCFFLKNGLWDTTHNRLRIDDADQRLKIYSTEVVITEFFCKYPTKYDMTICCET